MSNVHTETPAPCPPGQEEFRACLQSLLLVCFLAEAVLPKGTMELVLSSSSMVLFQVLLAVLGTQAPFNLAPQDCVLASRPGQHGKGLDGGQALPLEPAFCSTLLPGEVVAVAVLSRRASFMASIFYPLPVRRSRRKGWRARPGAVLQGPEA